jgi:hypothetical protein
MIGKTPEALRCKTEESKDDATKNILAKLRYFETEVDRHIKSKIPMGLLPRTLSKFVDWEVKGLISVNRSTIYQKHNKRIKLEISNLCGKVKNPPLVSSSEQKYRQEVKHLNIKLSKLAEINIELNGQIEDLVVQLGLVVQKSDGEIKHLKEIINKTERIRVL